MKLVLKVATIETLKSKYSHFVKTFKIT